MEHEIEEKVNELGTETDIREIIQKSIDEFILHTSGYYDLKREPYDYELNLIKKNVLIEIYCIDAALVSSFCGIIPNRFLFPAAIIEFFINNRLHGEMIMRISRKNNQELTPKEFLYCISNYNAKPNAYGEEQNLENFIVKMVESLSRSMVKTSSQQLFNVFTGGIFSFVPFINSILSGLFTYDESKKIANNTSIFLESKMNPTN